LKVTRKDYYTKAADSETSQAKPMTNRLDAQQKNLAAKLLKDAPHFSQALQQDFSAEKPPKSLPTSLKEMVEHFSTCAPEQDRRLA
jgi:hypothetical protein